MATSPDLTPSSEPAAGLSRRSVLARTATGLGITLTGSLGGLFGTEAALAGPRRDDDHGNGHGRGHRPDEVGYGPLVDDPRDLLSLPAGFTYTIVAQSGVTRLETGEPTPSDPDGSASFVRRGGNGDVLINNHEVSGTEPSRSRTSPASSTTTRPSAARRTSRSTGTATASASTSASRGPTRTALGGRSPWDTWLTCEETEAIKGKPHGYVFEVDPYDQNANRDPKPIKALGRYAHESLVVDPRRHTIYLTEDATAPNGLLYRWTSPEEALPLRHGSLRALVDDAGELDALKAFSKDGAFVPDLSVATVPGTTYRVEWVPVPDRDATTTSTRKQFAEITRSRKLEGMWWGDDGAFFVASFARTTDGSAAQHDGQVWFLDPEAGTIELRLHFAYTPADQDTDPDGPDNITVSAFGGLIIAEDGDGVNHLLGSTEKGEVFFFARNEHLENSEFAGPNFSHDKRILFANVQSPGFVYAIKGPFRRQR
jgi:uncharacterized protein